MWQRRDPVSVARQAAGSNRPGTARSMTVCVETALLLRGDDWLQEWVGTFLEDENVVSSHFAYLEIILVGDREDFEYVP